MSMIDWQKDAHQTMWFLSSMEREKRGCKLTDEQRVNVQESLKQNVARYIRMATQKNAGQRGSNGDLDTLNSLNITEMAIIIAAADLCLDGVFGPMPGSIEGDEYVWKAGKRIEESGKKRDK